MQDERPFSEELEEEVAAAQTWMLPCKELHGLWGSLYYEDDLKENVMMMMMITIVVMIMMIIKVVIVMMITMVVIVMIMVMMMMMMMFTIYDCYSCVVVVVMMMVTVFHARQLLEYMRTTLLFSDSKVNPDVVTWNRLILLHGLLIVGSNDLRG